MPSSDADDPKLWRYPNALSDRVGRHENLYPPELRATYATLRSVLESGASPVEENTKKQLGAFYNLSNDIDLAISATYTYGRPIADVLELVRLGADLSLLRLELLVRQPLSGSDPVTGILFLLGITGTCYAGTN